MNRLKVIIVIFILILVFSGCEGNEEKDTTLPTFTPIVDKVVAFGHELDPLDDIIANDNIDGDLTSDVECVIYNSKGTETIDITETDVYTQICTVVDSSGNTANIERQITVEDELIGSVISGLEDLEIGYGSFFDPLSNLEIIDKLDGNITDQVVIKYYTRNPNEVQLEMIDTSIIGSYYVDYSVINSLDIKTEVRIEVDVIDLTGPNITATDLELFNDGFYNLLAGITANDEIDGTIEEITYTIYDGAGEEVEYIMYLHGEYILRYEAFDLKGNLGSKEVSLRIFDLYSPELSISEYVLEIFPDDEFNIEDNFTYTDISDEELILEYTIQDAATSEYVENLSISDYGFYFVRVTVTDQVGHEDLGLFYLNITTGVLEDIEADIDNAEIELIDFYYNVRNNHFNNDEVCDMYVGDRAFDVGITYSQCISGNNTINSLTSDENIISTTFEVIGGITYYTSEVEFTRPDEDVIKEIRYRVVQYEHSLYPHVIFISDPYDVAYPISVFQPEFEMVDNYIMSFYSMLRNPSIPSSIFCQMDVLDTIHNSVTYDDCRLISDLMETDLLSYTVNSYEVALIPFGDGSPLDGYQAEITIARPSLVQTFTIDIIFFEQGSNQTMLIVGGFFGPDFDYGLTFEEGTNTIREDEVSDFYDDLLDESISAIDFCETSYLISPAYDMDINQCVAYVESVRGENVTYTINSITPSSIEALGGTVDTFTLDIEFTHNGIIQPLLIDFVLLEKDDELYPVFFDLYLVNLNYEEELNHAVIGSKAYSSYIQGFYEDVEDSSISNAEFCQMYQLTGGASNEELTLTECMDIRFDFLKNTYNFEIVEITYEDIGNPEFPPVYTVNMKRNTFTSYEIGFTLYYNPLGELIIKVNLDDALGGGFD